MNTEHNLCLVGEDDDMMDRGDLQEALERDWRLTRHRSFGRAQRNSRREETSFEQGAR